MTAPAEESGGPAPPTSPIEEREWPFPWQGPFLYALSLRPIVASAARSVGISRQNAYLAAAADPEFAEAWKQAKQVGKELLEQVIWQRATRGEPRRTTRTTTRTLVDRSTGEVRDVITDEVVEDSQHVSDVLAMFMLKKLDPSYRERADVRLLGPDDGPIQLAVQHEVFRVPTRERMLELAQMAVQLELPPAGEAIIDLVPDEDEDADQNGSGNGAVT